MGGGVCCLKRPLGEAEEEECTTLGFNTVIYRYSNDMTLMGHHHKRKPQEYQTKRGKSIALSRGYTQYSLRRSTLDVPLRRCSGGFTNLFAGVQGFSCAGGLYEAVTRFKGGKYRNSGESVRATPPKRSLPGHIQVGATRRRGGTVSRLRLGGEKRCITSKKRVVEAGVIGTNTRFTSRLRIRRTFPQPSTIAIHSLTPLSHLL